MYMMILSRKAFVGNTGELESWIRRKGCSRDWSDVDEARLASPTAFRHDNHFELATLLFKADTW